MKFYIHLNSLSISLRHFKKFIFIFLQPDYYQVGTKVAAVSDYEF